MLSEAPILLRDSVWTVGLWENAYEFILMQRQVRVKEGKRGTFFICTDPIPFAELWGLHIK